MNDFLLALFYQAIVAVNTAVILSGIIWFAKRKDEKGRRKPDPDFTPLPEKKPHGYHLTMTTDDAKNYGKAHTFNGEEYERTMVAQSADGTAISMIYRRKYPHPMQSFIGEVRGGCGNQVLGTVTAKSAEELNEKLEAFSKLPITVFNPAEETVKRYEARTAQLPHYCGNCIAHRQDKFDGEIIHVCMRHKVWIHNQERWDGGCDAWEPSPAICKLYKLWADGFCSSCKYFEPEEPGQKRGMGLCARNDKIKMMGQSCTGYARKGELPKYLERQPMKSPKPLGTITTH